MIRRSISWVLAMLIAATVFAAPPQPGKYSVAGIDDDAAVEEFLADLKEAVASNDREAVASMIAYPLVVHAGKAQTTIRDEAALVKSYDAVFTSRVKKALAAQSASKLFVNAEGVMIGNGEIWFGMTEDDEILVIAVNR